MFQSDTPKKIIINWWEEFFFRITLYVNSNIYINCSPEVNLFCLIFNCKREFSQNIRRMTYWSHPGITNSQMLLPSSAHVSAFLGSGSSIMAIPYHPPPGTTRHPPSEDKWNHISMIWVSSSNQEIFRAPSNLETDERRPCLKIISIWPPTPLPH